MEPIIILHLSKEIIDSYNKVTLRYDLIHINFIGFLNNISQQIMFYTGIIIKNLKIKNIEDGINQIHKLNLKLGFKITRIYSDREFEPIQS